jgi:GDP-L-fucose synthase
MTYLTGKRLIVTGGAGFLGSVVVEKLKEHDPQDIFVPRSRDFDLRTHKAVVDLISEKNPDAIIHMAAVVGGIGANQERPATFFYDNLMMGTHLLHESWKAGVRKFVTIGTVCAYPKFTPVPFHEDDLWKGYPEETNAPYGLAKKMLLVQGNAYRQQYGFKSIFLLPTNLYGPGDNFDQKTSHVIPALIRKCLEAKEQGASKIVAWGTGSPTREFLYVDDAAEAIVMATEKYDGPEPVNIGSSMEISIKELLTLIAELTGFSGEVVWDSSKPDGQPRRKLDTSRALKSFGFQSHTDFREGLQKTIDWYLQSRASE